MQSFRRSVRQSFRRRTGTSITLDDRKKIATSLNLEDGNKVKGHRKRAATEPASDLSPAHAGGLQVRDYNVHEYFTDYNYVSFLMVYVYKYALSTVVVTLVFSHPGST